MLQMVKPQWQLVDNYQDLIVGIYVSLVGKKGKIGGLDVSAQNSISWVDFSEVAGIKTLIRFFASVSYAFPQYTLNFEQLITRGEKIMAKYSITGIPTGKIMGIEPAGQLLRVNGFDLFRMNQRKVVAYWNLNHQIEPA